MNDENRLVAFILRHAPVLILGGSFALSSLSLGAVLKFDVSRLKAFGAVSQIYFTGIKNGLIISTAILFLSFVSFLFLKKYVVVIKERLEYFYMSLDSIKKNILILAICFAFVFMSHSGNILSGYFDMDDFTVIDVNQTTSLGQSLLITHADHTIPLFRVEMRALYSVFGQNPLPYNMFVFIVFSLIPFFTYLIFKRLGLRTVSWLIFLVLYSGSMAWSEMITGYYIISVYHQVMLFFVISMWSSLAWAEEKKWPYLAIFSMSLLGALLIDISGIWTIPAIIFFMAMLTARSGQGTEKGFFRRFIEEHGSVLIITAIISALFAALMAFTFLVLYPNSSPISTGYNLTLLGLAKNIMSIISSGMTLSILAPNITKIIAYPSFENTIGEFWPVLELIILSANIVALRLILKKSGRKNGAFILFLISAFVLTVAMVVMARPNESNLPIFDFKHVGMSFYFYCVLLALGGALFIESKKDRAVKIILPVLIVIIALQQAFGFFAFRLRVESQVRESAIKQLRNQLVGELVELSKNNSSVLRVPNLDGQYIYHPLGGYTLADYLPFFDVKIPLQLVRNDLMNPDMKTNTVLKVPSLRGGTSNSFMEALRVSPTLKSYYASKVLMTYGIGKIQNMEEKNLIIPAGGDATILSRGPIDPEKRHLVYIDLSTDNTPGSTEVYFSFENDFGAEGRVGQIKVDDYTPYILANNERRYNITTDLLQLYTYSLSREVRNVKLESSSRKNMRINSVYFE